MLLQESTYVSVQHFYYLTFPGFGYLTTDVPCAGKKSRRQKLFIYPRDCRLYNANCTLYTVPCKLYTVHCTMQTVHCTLYSLRWGLLYSVHCTSLYTLYTSKYSNVHIFIYYCASSILLISHFLFLKSEL